MTGTIHFGIQLAADFADIEEADSGTRRQTADIEARLRRRVVRLAADRRLR